METHLVTAGGTLLQVPLTYRDEPLDGAEGALITEMQHSVLGTRWVYDGLRDPRLVVMLAAVAMTGQGEALGMAPTRAAGTSHRATYASTVAVGPRNECPLTASCSSPTTPLLPCCATTGSRSPCSGARRPRPRPAIGLTANLGRVRGDGRRASPSSGNGMPDATRAFAEINGCGCTTRSTEAARRSCCSTAGC
jgi:hypothetical protein